MAKRVLKQKKTDSHKLYSLHAPEVECTSKGKNHKRYEFGVKASVARTNKRNFIVGSMALPGNSFAGYTLVDALCRRAG
jgi:IS5 family transposase